MKQALIFNITFLVSLSVMADISPSEFDSMISEETLSAEMLQKKIQSDSGIEIDKTNFGKISPENIKIATEVEQVAVTSGASHIQSHKKSVGKNKKNSANQKTEFKRMSEEVESANAF